MAVLGDPLAALVSTGRAKDKEAPLLCLAARAVAEGVAGAALVAMLILDAAEGAPSSALNAACALEGGAVVVGRQGGAE